jgi:hypothetical protein
VEVAALDEELGRQAGVLLGRSRRSDVIDAALLLLARDGDEVLTSDPGTCSTFRLPLACTSTWCRCNRGTGSLRLVG